MRVIVTGGRFFDDISFVRLALSTLPSDTVVVHGSASGADTLADQVALELGLEVERHPAKWKMHDWNGISGVKCHHRSRPDDRCPAAGPRRNQEMADLGADLCIAFPGGSGTADMKKRAKAAGIEVIEAQLLVDTGWRLA